MVCIISNESEYENIVLILKGNGDRVSLSKDAKYRLKKKSKNFLLVDNILYLRDGEGLHKRVFHAEQKDIMMVEAKKLHKSNHYGINKFEEACNQMFLKYIEKLLGRL
ncbi:hypothetical protein NGRA_3339 [Nosema granulosis]|uniref:Uncharacterized protein n=1 Tax=Nosema granulosis TaxID=83296 RepID=A0A9P6KXL1_9MICR|nr:hypothetical protein NGRA_3339 [Nosema granulosis]